MPGIETTNNPLTPPATNPSGNIASLANPNTVSTLKSIQSPKAFGDQLTNVAVQQLIKAATESTLYKLQKEKADLIREGIELDIKHQLNIQQIEKNHTPAKKVVNGQTVDIPPVLSDDEYRKALANEEKNYLDSKKDLQERKDKNQEDINDYLKDPFKKQKEERQKRKEANKRLVRKNDADRKKAQKAKRDSILKNATKTLVPILTLLLTDKIAELISQNDKIQKLVDDTNALIIEANQSGDPIKLSNAKIARDNAITVIQNNENKITKIRDQINRISIYINIFSLIVAIISAIPIPTSVPPGAGIPVSLIITLVKILQRASTIINELSAYLPIILVSLQKAIDILNDLKAQLLNINGQLDTAATSGSSDLLLNTGEGGITLGIFPETYKKFKFAIEEENNPKFIVRGYKRHYAVAIDTNNVKVLKSELSFTLDPNDLIDQLKLIIDRENLIA
jgi:hypothetical protein